MTARTEPGSLQNSLDVSQERRKPRPSLLTAQGSEFFLDAHAPALS